MAAGCRPVVLSVSVLARVSVRKFYGEKGDIGMEGRAFVFPILTALRNTAY